MDIKELKELLEQKSKDFKEGNEQLQTQVKEFGAESKEAKELAEKNEKTLSDLKELFEKLDTKLVDVEKEQKRFNAQTGSERKTIGQLFTEKADLNAAYQQKRAHVDMDRKDITSLAASAGALVRPDRDPEVYRDPSRPMRIRDLIPSIPTQSNAIEIMRQNVFTNNAGPQSPAEPDGTIGEGDLQTKPESNITWELVTVSVKTMAHWVPASRQILNDAPQLQSLIDTELTYGLDLLSDAQLLLGDGTGQNVTGLMVDGDVTDIGAMGEIPAGTEAAAMIDHIRAAVTAAQLNEYYNINGLVLNPVDWQKLETAKATDGHYLLVAFAATSSETPNVWRIPVIVTNAMPADEFLIGDWTMGAKVYEREDVSVRVSESHEDLFVKNGIVILAEERYAFGINRPKAFVKGSFEFTNPE